MTFEEIQTEARRLVKDCPEPTEVEFARMDELIAAMENLRDSNG